MKLHDIRFYRQIISSKRISILSIGIKYPMHDEICDVNYGTRAVKLWYWHQALESCTTF